MKKILPALFVFALSALSSCNNQCITPAEEVHDTIVVHDTITLTPDTVYLHAGEYINNIPCKTNIIHPEAPGKALLFLWLHGGVHHPQGFTLLRNDGFSAIQYTNVPKHAIEYLERNNIKAIVLCPICKQANTSALQTWPDCWPDIKLMIDGYVDKGIVDKSRIYVAGSSDGGTGTWQYVSQHSDIFAAGIALSSSLCLPTSVPVFWCTTKAEGDQSERARQLRAQGMDVTYTFCGDVPHGGDERECNDDLFARFFGIRKP